MPKSKKLDDETKQDLERLLRALEVFKTARPTMPLQYIISFLQVALEEGQSVNDYANKANVAQNVMSRHLLDIGPRDRNQNVGFGWVEHHLDPLEMRKHKVYLSDRGQHLARVVGKLLRGTSTKGGSNGGISGEEEDGGRLPGRYRALGSGGDGQWETLQATLQEP